MTDGQDHVVDFIRAAKERGTDDQFIVSLLRQNGWSERRVYDAFGAYYTSVGVPLPAKAPRIENARDAFMYLLAFLTLGIWTTALIWLANALIDRILVNPLTTGASLEPFRSEVAGNLASLIVAFPIFLIVSHAIAQEVRRRPEALDSAIRKWLIYIALVIAAGVLVGDAVWFLQGFLRGDLTARFALKAAVLFFVAGCVFWYYLGAVRAELAPVGRDRAFAIVSTAVVCAAVISGFFGIGTPLQERRISSDERRVSDLQYLAQRIYSDRARANRRTPPRDLQALAPDADLARTRDPMTQKPYEYHTGNGSAYTVCANFATDNRSESDAGFWAHAAGRKCFHLDALHGEP